jgi:hypothetical protein
MRLISVYSALAAGGWISLDILFVIAWARLRSAERHFQHQIKAAVIEFPPNVDGVRSRSNAHHLAS